MERDYLVLRVMPQIDTDDMYLPVGTVKASAAEQACRRMAADLEPEMVRAGVELVAVVAAAFVRGRVLVRSESQLRLVTSPAD